MAIAYLPFCVARIVHKHPLNANTPQHNPNRIGSVIPCSDHITLPSYGRYVYTAIDSHGVRVVVLFNIKKRLGKGVRQD